VNATLQLLRHEFCRARFRPPLYQCRLQSSPSSKLLRTLRPFQQRPGRAISEWDENPDNGSGNIGTVAYDNTGGYNGSV